jgi:hypothetical protein
MTLKALNPVNIYKDWSKLHMIAIEGTREDCYMDGIDWNYKILCNQPKKVLCYARLTPNTVEIFNHHVNEIEAFREVTVDHQFEVKYRAATKSESTQVYKKFYTTVSSSESSESEKDEDESDLCCPICFTTPKTPTAICWNGHSICATCKPKVNNCPICRQRYAGKNFLLDKYIVALSKAKKRK